VVTTAHAPGLTVAATARRIGVAPGTLRTWDRRYGMGPSDHTPGRHRRYSTADVARLELMQRALVRGVSPADAARYALSVREPESAPVPPGPGEQRAGVGCVVPGPPGAAGADGLARGVGRAALALDSATVCELLAESVARDGVENTWDEVVRPVLAAVGARWAHTAAGVEIEHLVTGCVSAVFGAPLSGGGQTARDVRPVLLAAVPGEQHTLPLLALAAALRRHGVAHRYLGADLPADALVAAAHGPGRRGALVVAAGDRRSEADRHHAPHAPPLPHVPRGPRVGRCGAPAAFRTADVAALGRRDDQRGGARVSPDLRAAVTLAAHRSVGHH
jgi:DNA-binding transcriptional MerR regulator